MLGLWLLLPPGATAQIAEEPPIVHAVDAAGNPTFMTGDLGSIGAIDVGDLESDPKTRQQAESVAQSVLEARIEDHFGALGSEAFELSRIETDDLGAVHFRYRQTLDGLPVDLAELVLHAWADSGEVFALNGGFGGAAGAETSPALSGPEAVTSALTEAAIENPMSVGPPTLTYLLEPTSHAVFLTYRVKVAYVESASLVLAEEPPSLRIEDLYVDAVSGELVARLPRAHTLEHRSTYSAEGQSNFAGAPDAWPFLGDPLVLHCQDDVCLPEATPMSQQAHDHVGTAYDYFLARFGRLSFDGRGGEIRVTTDFVFPGNDVADPSDDILNVAGWWSTPDPNDPRFSLGAMLLGPGDGIAWHPPGRALDVVAHEITHGVTSNSARLIYFVQPGGLNEAMSDIFAAAAEAWADGGITPDTWKLGEDALITGEAVRFMNDPERDFRSYDHFQDYLDAFDLAQGEAPMPDVHFTSGIANLAFYLLVEGGFHPRIDHQLAWNDTEVPAIGLAKAEQIFYDTLTLYLTPSSNFETARYASQQAAYNRYGAETADAVHRAWCAVGVPQCSIVVVNHPPMADFSADCADGAGEPATCSFDATASTDDDFISSYQWTFGDGQNGEGLFPEHTYPAYGTYPVTLRVEDAQGLSDTVTQEVRIGPIQPPTPLLPSLATAVEPGAVTFTWSNGPAEAVRYRVKVHDVTAGTNSQLHNVEIPPTAVSQVLGGFVDGRDYKWTIRAELGAGGTTAWTPWAHFVVRTPGLLDPPTLVAPAQGSVLAAGAVTFSWNPGGTAPSYRVVVERTTGGTTVVHDTLVSSATTEVVLSDFQQGIGYRWRMRTESSPTVVGAWTPWIDFSILDPSGPPTPLDPTVGASRVPGDVEFRWAEVAGPIRYRVVVQDLSQGNVVIHHAVIDAPADSVTLSGFVEGHGYRWKVRADFGGSNTGWSNWSTFDVMTPPPPVRQAPAQGAQVPSGDVFFDWDPVPQATRYRMVVQDASNTVLHTLTVDAPVTNATLLGFVTGTYRWRVRAEFGNGIPTTWGSWISFSVIP